MTIRRLIEASSNPSRGGGGGGGVASKDGEGVVSPSVTSPNAASLPEINLDISSPRSDHPVMSTPSPRKGVECAWANVMVFCRLEEAEAEGDSEEFDSEEGEGEEGCDGGQLKLDSSSESDYEMESA